MNPINIERCDQQKNKNGKILKKIKGGNRDFT